MKKIIRTVWISALTGLAFLVACNTQHRMKKEVQKQVDVAEQKHNAERDSLVTEINEIRASEFYNKKRYPAKYRQLQQQERSKLERIYAIDLELNNGKADSTKNVLDNIIQSSITPKVYGPPTTVYGPPATNIPGSRIIKLQKEREFVEKVLEQTNDRIRGSEGEKLYGSPEVIERRQQEMDNLQKVADSLQRRLDDLDNTIKKLKKQ
ncbi:MAG: hypothetical protein J6P73_09495 [Bacteroidales bacterium]|nr:hypothetical protein [Bacteroidales bacterium]